MDELWSGIIFIIILPLSVLSSDRISGKTFTINGKAPQKGEIFKNPDLGNTLDKIAHPGRDIFYKGEIARTIDAYVI